MLHILGGVAQFERAIIKERPREGIAIAKQAGAYKGRRPSLTTEQVAEIRKRAKTGEQKTRLAVYSFRAQGLKTCLYYSILDLRGTSGPIV